MPLPVIAIFGPTAVGKTAVAVGVAQKLRAAGQNPVAIGVDALQVYDGLPLITAQPTPDEHSELEHRLVGFVPLTETWSVAQHTELAHREIDDALAAGRVPIVVGGTGLYLRSALTDLTLAPAPEAGLRDKLAARADEPGGLEALYAELEELDPVSAALMHPNDRTRIMRAHELLAAGKSFADASGQDELWTDDTRVPTVLVGLTMERSALRKRAGERMRAMVEAGAIEEVRAAAEADIGPTAAAAVGFRELFYGEVDIAVTKTRQLAKRQETWMRRLGGVTILDVTARTPDDVADEIVRRWQDAASEG
ncbi:MAG: tRNA (adenosine(37)-N6)-dimethylallyltransferase MiaA [Solirubrobacteraceae bacterium]|nr:tRNA (adenosine(37)-N6)-dimethylallyltransferase MiaA [Solirubrobacteraceae bacterium]